MHLGKVRPGATPNQASARPTDSPTPPLATPMSNTVLPPDAPNQAYITVSALNAGYLWLPEREFIDPCDETAVHKAPSLSFFLVHQPSGTKLVYDLGMRKDWENYPPAIEIRIATGVRKIDVSVDVRDSVVSGGVDPNDVDVVIVSHVHYDHTGNPNQFPNAKYIIGPGSLELIRDAAGVEDPLDNWFTEQLLPDDKSKINQLPPYTSPEWKPLGLFEHTFDYFGDGSFYLVDSTGHLPGHINGLVRIAPNRFVYLASDSCHFTSILSGDCGIAIFKDPKGDLKCIHSDKAAAEKHLDKIRELRDRGGENVEIVLAHELGWEDKHPERFLPGKFT
jgi:glyoxylase-like metal-dependent hydrolase (beta-lactamase superfamily II)